MNIRPPKMAMPSPQRGHSGLERHMPRQRRAAPVPLMARPAQQRFLPGVADPERHLERMGLRQQQHRLLHRLAHWQSLLDNPVRHTGIHANFQDLALRLKSEPGFSQIRASSGNAREDPFFDETRDKPTDDRNKAVTRRNIKILEAGLPPGPTEHFPLSRIRDQRIQRAALIFDSDGLNRVLPDAAAEHAAEGECAIGAVLLNRTGRRAVLMHVDIPLPVPKAQRPFFAQAKALLNHGALDRNEYIRNNRVTHQVSMSLLLGPAFDFHFPYARLALSLTHALHAAGAYPEPEASGALRLYVNGQANFPLISAEPQTEHLASFTLKYQVCNTSSNKTAIYWIEDFAPDAARAYPFYGQILDLTTFLNQTANPHTRELEHLREDPFYQPASSVLEPFGLRPVTRKAGEVMMGLFEVAETGEYRPPESRADQRVYRFYRGNGRSVIVNEEE